MTAFLSRTDDLLRGRLEPLAVPVGAPPGAGARGRPATAGRALAHLLATVVLFGLFYGAVMGAYGAFARAEPPAPPRPPAPHASVNTTRPRLPARGARAHRVSPNLGLQMLYSAVKVPLLLLVTFALSLPSFFVLNTVLGVRGDFGRVMQGLVATQAGLTVVLAALAPLTAFWYASVPDYSAALLFNAAAFGVASLAAQWILRRYYRPLVALNPRHRALLRGWVVIYAFVGIQMAWLLRPFIGDPHTPTAFFRADAWGNAYVELARVASRAVEEMLNAE